MKLPDITKLVGSKNFATDAGIILLGFVIIGFASAAGTWAFKWVHNNYIKKDQDQNIPY